MTYEELLGELVYSLPSKRLLDVVNVLVVRDADMYYELKTGVVDWEVKECVLIDREFE